MLNMEKFQKDYGAVENLLLGNGFCLSHPSLKDKYLEVGNSKILGSIELEPNSKPLFFPEGYLGAWRLNMCKKIIEQYFQAFMDDGNSKSLVFKYRESCKEFLASRKNIFTLNYDPLLYAEILKNQLNYKANSQPGFVDGFGRGSSEKKTIVDNMKNILLNDNKENRAIYYLHGAWFIQAIYDEQNKDKKRQLKKVSFSSKNPSELKYEDLFENGHPHLILEDRSSVKRTLVKNDTYFKYCHQQLQKIKGRLLCFGCSFDKDDHIVDIINKNESLQNIYITVFKDQDKKTIEDKFNKSKDKVEFLSIEDNVIWK